MPNNLFQPGSLFFGKDAYGHTLQSFASLTEKPDDS